MDTKAIKERAKRYREIELEKSQTRDLDRLRKLLREQARLKDEMSTLRHKRSEDRLKMNRF